jgi:hypothetical protein
MTNPNARDASERIDVSQKHECRYWSERYAVSPERLKQVVKEVGPMVRDVRKRLRKKGYRSELVRR